MSKQQTFIQVLDLHSVHLAMDRPDIQFAVKTLPSYMARPNVKALSALRHLASHVGRYDELICDEINVPQEKSEAKFNLDAFSDSSWQIASLLAAA